MNTEDLKQGSEEWKESRRGIPTASEFSRIVTGTGKVASSAVQAGYRNELLAERFGLVSEWNGNSVTDRGNELEPEAVSGYELIKDVDCEETGLVTSECGRYGGSPDRIIYRGSGIGGLETKCFEGKKHIATVLGGKIPAAHLSQVYGCLLVTGANWWDWFAYHPKLQPLLVRVERTDEKYVSWCDVFKEQIEKFCDKLDDCEKELRI